MTTTVPVGDPKAQKKWSHKLFLDILNESYFEQKFVGKTDNNVIQRLTDLESEAGDTIDYDLSVRLRNEPVAGDNRLEDSEEGLRFYSDEVMIDQLRHAASSGGKMARKRTVHNMRNIAKTKLAEYWGQVQDELNFIYLSGARGINEDYIFSETYVGHAGNPIQEPDADHLLYGYDDTATATASNNLTATQTMSVGLIERAVTKARMMSARNPDNTNMVPLKINGEKHYVCIMSPYQEHDMRTSTSNSGWLEIQKAAAGAEGRRSKIFRGGLGMINKVVLHCHERVIRFNDYGSGSNVEAARALFLGRQGGVIAYGSTEKRRKMRFSWEEEWKDYKNELGVAAGMIFGCKKSRFNDKDFGLLSIDTAAADPTT